MRHEADLPKRHASFLFLPGAGQKPPDFLPFKDDDRKNRTQLNGDFRIGGDVSGEAESMAYQDKMSRGRDGQELSQSFDDSQYYCERWAPFIHAYTMLGFEIVSEWFLHLLVECER